MYITQHTHTHTHTHTRARHTCNHGMHIHTFGCHHEVEPVHNTSHTHTSHTHTHTHTHARHTCNHGMHIHTFGCLHEVEPVHNTSHTHVTHTHTRVTLAIMSCTYTYLVASILPRVCARTVLVHATAHITHYTCYYGMHIHTSM